jgi:hypothetical protein
MDARQTQGCLIWLNQPMKWVKAKRGIRLVSKKFKSSWAPKPLNQCRTVIIVSS